MGREVQSVQGGPAGGVHDVVDPHQVVRAGGGAGDGEVRREVGGHVDRVEAGRARLDDEIARRVHVAGDVAADGQARGQPEVLDRTVRRDLQQV